MTPEKSEVLHHFLQISENFFHMHMIGYHDFHYLKTWEFYRTTPVDAFHYVRSGHGYLHVGEKTYRLEPGDFFFIKANTPVMYHADREHPYAYYWIDFYSDAQFKLNEILFLSSAQPVRHAKHPALVNGIFDELFQTKLSTFSLYYATLAAVMRIISLEATGNSSQQALSSKGMLVENAKLLIALNYTRVNFSIEDMAAMLHVTSRHIRRLFQENVGMTPVAYLADYRLQEAHQLLTQKDCTVEELCAAVGWNDRLYFMKRFKQKYHMTVREYRTSIRPTES